MAIPIGTNNATLVTPDGIKKLNKNPKILKLNNSTKKFGFFVFKNRFKIFSVRFVFFIALAKSIPEKTNQKAEDEKPENMSSLGANEKRKDVNKKIKDVKYWGTISKAKNIIVVNKRVIKIKSFCEFKYGVKVMYKNIGIRKKDIFFINSIFFEFSEFKSILVSYFLAYVIYFSNFCIVIFWTFLRKLKIFIIRRSDSKMFFKLFSKIGLVIKTTKLRNRS